MKRHTVDIKDIIGNSFDQVLACAKGKGNNKDLIMRTSLSHAEEPTVIFVVLDHLKECFRSGSINLAVKRYNEL